MTVNIEIANGSTLDHYAAFYGIARAVGEDDKSVRDRVRPLIPKTKRTRKACCRYCGLDTHIAHCASCFRGVDIGDTRCSECYTPVTHGYDALMGLVA